MSRAHELSWCAGFFDGEGYISIVERTTPYKDKIYKGHYLRIGINHVNPEPLIEMQRILGGNFVYDKSSERPSADSFKRKPRYKWLATTAKAAIILIQLLPYFHNKNKAAEIGLELQKTMQIHKKTVTPELFEKRALLKIQLMELNSLD